MALRRFDVNQNHKTYYFFVFLVHLILPTLFSDKIFLSKTNCNTLFSAAIFLDLKAIYTKIAKLIMFNRYSNKIC